MPIFPSAKCCLPVNRIWLFTEVGQHIQMPQGILVLQENKEPAHEPFSQLACFCIQTQSHLLQPGVLGLFGSWIFHHLSIYRYLHTLAGEMHIGKGHTRPQEADGSAKALSGLRVGLDDGRMVADLAFDFENPAERRMASKRHTG